MASTDSLGLAASEVYLHMDLKMLGRSMLPYSPAPDWLAGRWAAPAVGGVGQHQHGRAAEHGFHNSEGGRLEPMNSPCPITTAGLPVARP